MEITHVTVLTRTGTARWSSQNIDAIGIGLRRVGFKCLVCWDYRYPYVVVIMADCRQEMLQGIIPAHIPYLFGVQEVAKSVMLRKICHSSPREVPKN